MLHFIFWDESAWADSGDTQAYLSLDFTDDDLKADLTRAYISVAEPGHHDGLAGSDEYNAWHWLQGRGGLSAFNLHAIPSSSSMHNDPSDM